MSWFFGTGFIHTMFSDMPSDLARSKLASSSTLHETIMNLEFGCSLRNLAYALIILSLPFSLQICLDGEKRSSSESFAYFDRRSSQPMGLYFSGSIENGTNWILSCRRYACRSRISQVSGLVNIMDLAFA